MAIHRFESNIDCEKASKNFSFIKTFSIFTVITGHYFGGILWIPTTFALCIFGFASGFFTSENYKNKTTIKYYEKKLNELPIRLLIINLFVSLLIITTKEQYSLVNIDSVVHIVGLSGIYSWTSIKNESSLGLGLWYLTVLLIFYAIYPLIYKSRLFLFNKINLILLYFILYFLEIELPQSHMLWITIFSFYYGCYSKFNQKHIETIAILLLMSTFMAILSCGVFNLKNYGFIIITFFASSIPIIFLIKSTVKIDFLSKIFINLNMMLMEIYIIHPYLFIKFTKYQYINYIISLLTIITASLVLFTFYKKIKTEYHRLNIFNFSKHTNLK